MWIQGRLESPLQVWLLASDGDKPVGKSAASEQAARATAAEIARLLNLGRAVRPTSATGRWPAATSPCWCAAIGRDG
ncbi:MAG: hypothetical protein MZV65_46135 [Chromatiales bacterium]|nr:hypothetical protein [Chromatiales bacterium]